MIFSDKTLSQTLERTEGRANRDFVETRARIQPDSGAAWIEVGGTYAMYDGAESPLTQTFGLGLFEDPTTGHFDELEAFFLDRDAPVLHEVSPLADPSLLTLLSERGYRPIELTNVMFRQFGSEFTHLRPRDPKLTTRIAESTEVDLWAKTSADGWAAEHEGLGDFMLQFGRIGAQCGGARPFLAEYDGKPIATGSLLIYEDTCILAGASTIPEARNRGAQTALLEDRLAYAADHGCRIAMMGAAPGSQSQRNAQKNGFAIAYTRIKWQLYP